MSYARPLTGIEVKKAVVAAIREQEISMGQPEGEFSLPAERWLDCFSQFDGEHLTFPHVSWDLEGTIESTPSGVGVKGPKLAWATITLELSLGGDATLSRRFGEAAPLGTEVETKIFPSQQRSVRTPDTLRERWLQEPGAGVEPKPEEPIQSPSGSAAPIPAAQWVAIDADGPAPELPASQLVGELPDLPDTPEEPEPSEPAPASAPAPGRKAKAATKGKR